MITETILEVTEREKTGKGSARKLRAEGKIPIALYGGEGDAATFGIVGRELGAILRSDSGRNSIFSLNVPGAGATPVMIKYLDRDPVTGKIIHADLVRISLTETTLVTVGVNFVGESEGVKLGGGMLEVHAHAIEVECLPKDIPESIDTDISSLNLGDHLRAGDIKLPDGVTLASDEDFLVASVVAPAGGGGGEASAESTETPAAS